MILSASNIGWDFSQDTDIYKKMLECGFKGLEIAPTRIFPVNPYDNLKEASDFAKKIYDSYGFVITSMQSIWFGKTENLFENDISRKALLDYTKKAILFAKSCNCKNLVFGSPKNRNMPENAKVSDVKDFFLKIGDFAMQNNTVVSLEPNPTIYGTNFINTTFEAIDFVKEVNSDGLKVNFDLGTVINNNEDLSRIFEDISLINHIHISMPYLKPIEESKIHRELKNILIEKKYNKAVSIEMAKPVDINVYKTTIDYVADIFR